MPNSAVDFSDRCSSLNPRDSTDSNHRYRPVEEYLLDSGCHVSMFRCDENRCKCSWHGRIVNGRHIPTRRMAPANRILSVPAVCERYSRNHPFARIPESGVLSSWPNRDYPLDIESTTHYSYSSVHNPSTLGPQVEDFVRCRSTDNALFLRDIEHEGKDYS